MQADFWASETQEEGKVLRVDKSKHLSLIFVQAQSLFREEWTLLPPCDTEWEQQALRSFPTTTPGGSIVTWHLGTNPQKIWNKVTGESVWYYKEAENHVTMLKK